MKWIENFGKVCRKDGNTIWLEVSKDDFKKTLNRLKQYRARISSISGYDSGEAVEVIYHFDLDGKMVNIKLNVGRSDPEIGTITRTFPGAELFERELMEMLGIQVDGHPDPRNLFLDRKLSPKAPLRKKKVV
jgi:NADH:ubiquinone oxidoreductase subunit C